MRTKFHERLDELTDRLAMMCHLAGEAIAVATDALVHADLPLAERVFDLNDQIEQLRVPSEEQALALLALQAPVARDLRQVITGVYLVADLSRMGGLAQHVAESVRRRHPEHVASGEAEQLLAQMGRVAAESAGAAERVLRTRDPEQAAELDKRDYWPARARLDKDPRISRTIVSGLPGTTEQVQQYEALTTYARATYDDDRPLALAIETFRFAATVYGMDYRDLCDAARSDFFQSS